MGCNSNLNTKSSFGPLPQIKFDSLHKVASKKKFTANNDIQKKENIENFDKELNLFLDSNYVFVNWKGKMNDITVKELENFSIITSEISFETEEFREIKFTSDYIIKTEQLKNDSIYVKLKRIPIGSVVFFDGFIVRDIDNKIKYNDSYNLSKENRPNYSFNLLEISNTPRTDSLSVNLQKNIPIAFKVFALLKQKVKKEIREEEWRKKTKDLASSAKEDSLNKYEKDYMDRLKQYLFEDYMK